MLSRVRATVVSMRLVTADCQYECLVKEEKNGIEHTVRFPDHMQLEVGMRVEIKV